MKDSMILISGLNDYKARRIREVFVEEKYPVAYFTKDIGLAVKFLESENSSLDSLMFAESNNDFDAVFIIRADDKNFEADVAKWVGNSHLRVISAELSEDEQINELLKEIKFFLGIPQPLEIERKFLIKYPDLELLEGMKNCAMVDIFQTYLEYEDGSRIRVRKRSLGKSSIYIKTYKEKIDARKRIEKEERLKPSEYDKLVNDLEAKKYSISKKRYCIVYDNQYFELDVFPFWNEQAMLEIELSDEEKEVRLPDFVELIKEVTGDKAYANSTLAKTCY